MLSRTVPSSIFSKYNFYTNITILAAVSHDDERAAPSSIFLMKLIVLSSSPYSKATKEKNFLTVHTFWVWNVEQLNGVKLTHETDYFPGLNFKCLNISSYIVG